MATPRQSARRDRAILVKLREREHRLIKLGALERGVPMSELVREAALAEARRALKLEGER